MRWPSDSAAPHREKEKPRKNPKKGRPSSVWERVGMRWLQSVARARHQVFLSRNDFLHAVPGWLPSLHAVAAIRHRVFTGQWVLPIP